MKLAIRHWKKTGIVTPKCPKCKNGVMKMTDCCYNSTPPVENYVCGSCGHEESYRGIYCLREGLTQAFIASDKTKRRKMISRSLGDMSQEEVIMLLLNYIEKKGLDKDFNKWAETVLLRRLKLKKKEGGE